MKPVAFLQHDPTQRPGFLMDYLHEIGVATRVFFPENDADFPRRASEFSGIVLLGSNHSVNDPLRWVGEEMKLVRHALDTHVPVLGHGFGAQLLAKALGATVCRNACPSIGWARMNATVAGQRLLRRKEVVAFNWHYETFSMPARAQRLLFSEHCMNKGFSLGPHVAFQCHFEITEAVVREWCARSAHELPRTAGPSVQTGEQILAQLPSLLPEVRRTARTVYASWAAGLGRSKAVAVPFRSHRPATGSRDWPLGIQ
ncbi:MAG: type 1 glutamine amidotransferase [Paucibacter sp.]|nr:type 1 glutamine amidotransferase [Roseateles sp.]